MTFTSERNAIRGRVGDRIGDRFELVALAGAGGNGEVFRARDLANGGALVALKLLRSEAGDAARFAREASLLASLDHPGVVRYLAHGHTDQGEPYLVMEWLAGEDLGARLARATLTPAEAIALARCVAEPLAEAHRRGIVHRDLKPANLFLAGEDLASVRIVDFGLARTIVDDGLSVTGVVLGTPAYMAPEQVRGEPVDAHADVYALGGVLFHALAGRPPFRGAHGIAVLAKVLIDDAPALRDVCPDASADLEALLARMLAKDPAQRPADASAVLAQLDALEAPRADAGRVPVAITGGEQRVACVVLCAPRAPQGNDAVTLVARAVVADERKVRDAIERRGGVLDALADGTLLVTVPGAASPAEQAARAARCALALGALRPDAPVVVVTGRVLRAEAQQVGEAIDRAAGALIAASEVAGVVPVRLDAATAELLDDRFEVAGEGAWRTLVGERDTLAPVRTFLGRAVRCVGRARELGSLADALATAADEPRATAVLVTAPPGLGKSRLVHEFIRASVADRARVDVLLARGDVARAGSPFATASQLIHRAARVLDSDPLATRTAKVRAMVTARLPGPDAARVADLLAEIAGSPVPHAEAGEVLRAARADATVMADAMREAWIDWLRAQCTTNVTVLVLLEDLHWGDLPSVRLIDAALEALEDRALMVLATARPEVHATFPSLWRARGLQELSLGPLARRAAEQMVREALGEGCDDAIVRALVERAAGEPFHLEELLRATLTGTAAVDALPDSVLGMIQARLEVLGADVRRVLRAASVFGGTFWAGGVAAVTGEPDGARAVEGHLARLRNEELVARVANSALAGESQYAFRHALVRDAAYATLTAPDRTVAHRLAGAWLELAGERDPAVLAEHHDRGGAAERALACFLRAAQQSLEGNDLDRATTLVERALGCSPGELELAKLRAVQSEVAFWRGELDTAAARAADAAEGLAPGSPGWFDAASVAIASLGQQGRNDRVVAWLLRAADAPSSPEARAAHVVALCRGLTQLYWAHHQGELGRVHARLDALSREGAAEAFETGWVRRVRAESAWLHAGDVDACLAGFDASCEAYEQAGALRALCLTRLNSASLHGWSGELERGREIVARSLADAERLRAGFLRNYGLTVRALLEAFAGEPSAEATFRAALAGVAASPRLAFLCRLYVGLLALERGDVAAAELEAQAAEALPVVTDLRPAALALRAAVQRARGELDASLATALEAVRLAAERGDLELTEGLAHLALVEAHLARDEHEATRAALVVAHGRLEAVAARIASPERRARFHARRFPNDRVRALALAWGVAR